MSTLRIIIAFTRDRRKALLVGALFVVLTNLLNVLVPSLIGRGVDMIAGGFAMRSLLGLSALILLIEIVKGVFRFLMRYIMIGASWNVEHDVRLRLYDHLLRLPLPYYTRTRTGDIIARLTNDLTAVRMMIGPAVMYTINALVLIPASLVFMLAIDPSLALYSIAPFPLIAVAINRAGKLIHARFKLVQESYSDISAHVQEVVSGIRVVKAYTREDAENLALERLSDRYVDTNRRVISVQSLFHPLLDILASAGLLIVLGIGGARVASERLSLGGLVAMIMYLGILVWPSIALGWVVAIYQRGSASARRIQDILDEEAERPDMDDDLSPLDGGITVSGLSYAYPQGTSPVLSDVSFSISPGGTLAIVGTTGSGKSTLIALMAGAYDVPRGCVAYDGVDIHDISLGRLRSSIGYVPQDSFLFGGTIRENIGFGRDDADDAAIREAARMAAVDGDIDGFPHGYDTVIGERGITVSAGQRQRLTIARALVRNAPILVFDDCLSNVDTATEMTILTNIADVIRERTTIIVTHRPGAVQDADEILFLEGGRIIERGDHASLMARDGCYAALFREQEFLDRMGEGQ